MLNARRVYRMATTAVTEYFNDYAMSMAAAISFYATFSLAPLLVIVTAIAGAVFGREAVEGRIVEEISGLIGREGAVMVQALVASAAQSDRGLLASLMSLAVLVVVATTVLAELQSSLDRIWRVPLQQRPAGVWGVLRTRLLSFGLILGLAFLLMVSLLVSAALAALGAWAGGLMPAWERLLWLLNTAVSLATFTLLFAMIYKLLPSTPIAWGDVWVGAFSTAVLFELGKLLIGLYLGASQMAASYKAAGSVVVLLAWVYYATAIFLLGAEFTRVYADQHGSRAGDAEREPSATPPARPDSA